jgi:23S rRNA (guanosine2251-2'-O)-methyltransferase
LADVDCVFFDQNLKTPGILDLRRLCAASGVAIKHVPGGKLNRLAEGANHQGVVAMISAVPLQDLDDVLSRIAPTRDDVETLSPLLVLPAQITDPHNLGAIVRSSVAFGSRAILIPDRHTARMDAVALKASAGAALRVPFARVKNIQQAIQGLKERGYWIVGLSGVGGTTLEQMDWARPIVVIVGSESEGLPTQVERACDFLVSIPISADVESLNASVAAGIALQAAGRCR